MDDMTLAEHAEAWYREQGIDMPSAPDVWQAMYEAWVEWAFHNEGNNYVNLSPER